MPDAPTPSLFAAALRHRLTWPLVTLALLLAVNTAFNASFLHIEWRDGHFYGSLVDILNRAAPLALVSLGMTMVIATRGIDISVGAVVAIAAAVGAWMIGGSVSGTESRFPLPLAMAGAIGAALLCGLWNGLLVAKVGMQPIIATLILMVAGRGIAQLITDGQIITIYYAPFFFLGGGYLLGLPFSLFVLAAVFAGLYLAVTRTALGLFIQAVGINPTAARVAGVQSRRLVVAAYAFCGVCAGIAGLLISSNVKSADANNAGQMLELDAILAVTLGGTALTGGRFSLVGSVIGALIIQTLTYAIYSLGVPPEINLVVKAVVVFIVMLLQSPDFRTQVGALVRRPAAGGALS
ncbi:permease component of ribose/xylose/arabinose/galactoside ABC-type transporters [Acidovorax sp. CF316]|uniref:ABC transporter permease n=1 Tax=Acidovorax sp. CF316 TaxID=1144317 RepID=UPI00026BBFC1|nr:ABC transporter permease [Acidovorax sp. CF316]EJE50293.1 permease component of ribose/xylose/arabinose/galactoside ABC-type transporters [Acidovorax sp. CF316]